MTGEDDRPLESAADDRSLKIDSPLVLKPGEEQMKPDEGV